MEECILEMRDITKTFPGVKALSNVNFKVKKGEIHCLVGENGAGKSTLMKVLSGVYPIGAYSGDIVYRGEVQAFKSIADSENAGIAIIYQELALIPELTLYENIYFGHELMSGKIIDWNKTIIEATKALRKVRLDINPSTKVKALGVGNQQLVEIAKALSKNVELLILDEPTAALNEDDSQNLLDLLRELKGQGVTCIMISHKLKEIISIADTITVLRDGATICSMDTKAQEVTEQEIIKYMVGREIENIYPKRAKKDQGEICFEIKDWTVEDVTKGREILHHISLNVRKGEIVGLQGLMGAGRTELAMSLFGNPSGYKMTSGEILLNGEAKTFKHPKDAIKAGIAYVTEDRKGNGLILIQDIRYNTTLANLEVLTKGNVINANEEINVANQYKNSINIKAPSIEQKVGNLSGGNQQKVSLAKWLFVQPKVLILDEPTRGIDVGAKYEIYTLMNRLVEEGMSIIMISSELPEVLGMSDRLYVMSNGTITGELTAEEATEQKVMAMATTR
ncbi:sugar ABC transporter ATP-binding protein [Cellulosilyticum sp. WCF-2]|uniref:sugar ABC transporter ATP-binding protein n=1 Tax=Cellulosilyticum sp. WCF-2 TaxID=2497860 RepID=UPI000F8EBDC0|nr:sugar ABC transporter ATP-binding protein [Cellulosilyticum sp. WCF-2]QEH68559.1 sugar ABC transporter ATP-binding protein [Cellulosilyticum sp. WCF-2]